MELKFSGQEVRAMAVLVNSPTDTILVEWLTDGVDDDDEDRKGIPGLYAFNPDYPEEGYIPLNGDVIHPEE